MDMRAKKTKRNIINAFLSLRAVKPTEKITVKELSELAEINKATFYLHYHDIYALSEELEKETVDSCLKGIEHPDYILSNLKGFIKELEDSFISNEQLIKLLFEGNRSNNFIFLFEKGLTEIIEREFPDFEIETETRMKITYIVSGGYYTYFRYCDNGIIPVLRLIEHMTDGIGNTNEKTKNNGNDEEKQCLQV